MGPAPVAERPLRFVLELETHTGLEVLGRVHPIAVEAELPHPVGQPLDDVIAWSAGVVRATKERV